MKMAQSIGRQSKNITINQQSLGTIHAGDKINNNSGKETLSERIDDLIVNLDHELPAVRSRALKCLIRKIDCGIIPTKDLCNRVDLLYRLTDFLQPEANPAVFEETFELLERLSSHEEFREVFTQANLDSFLTDLRDKVGFKRKGQIDSLLKSVGSFYLKCEDTTEVLNQDPYSGRSSKSTARSLRESYRTGSFVNTNMDYGGYSEYNDYNYTSTSDNYMPIRSKYSPDDHPIQSSHHSREKAPSHPSSTYGIPKVVLEASDRRVLNSTVESFLSKNESLVFITTCFFRDVLIHDFPPETFIQESSIVNSLIQVAETAWEDERLSYVAFQSLFKLNKLLRSRIACLNSTHFYRYIDTTQSSQKYYNYERETLFTSTDKIAAGICECLRNLSRSLLYNTPKSLLWILVDSFSYSLLMLIKTFSIDVKSLAMNLQEILLDVAHIYSKNYDRINPTIIGLIYISLLSCCQNEEIFILTSDVRRCIRTLSSDNRLFQTSPDVYVILIKVSSPFEPIAQDHEPANPNGSSGELLRILYGIQNATEHRIVLREIENLWEFIIGLSLNSRFNSGLEKNPLQIEKACQSAPWRETFSRFLSVEPTSPADEELLFKVLDLFTFLLSSMQNPTEITQWILPICFDQNAAGLQMISDFWSKSDVSSGSTMLQTIIFSWMDFYKVIISRELLIKDMPQKYLSEFFSTIIRILNDIVKDNITASAMLTVILEDLSILTANTFISSKIEANPGGMMVPLLQHTTTIMNILEEKSEAGSHRNLGSIQYNSLCVLHLFLILKRSPIPSTPTSSEWIIKCVNSMPFLWGSECAFIRASSFEITKLILEMEQGLSCFLLSLQNSAHLIWSAPYNLIVEPFEIPLVKQKAIDVVNTLLTIWGKIGEGDLGHVILPNWDVIGDLAKLLSKITWHQKLSDLVKKDKGKQNGHGMIEPQNVDYLGLITPGVLSSVCTLLKTMDQVKSVKQFHSDNFGLEIMNSGISTILFRIIGNHEISQNVNEAWWIECCSGLINALDCLIALSKNSRNISLILIGDRLDFSRMMELYELKPPNDKETSKELLENLWANIFTLNTHLCINSGNTFEDLEKNIWAQRDLFFPCVKKWLSPRSKPIYGKIALNFIRHLLTMISKFSSSANGTPHAKLCEKVGESGEETYGSELASSLIEIHDKSLELEEKANVLETLTILFMLSPSAKKNVIGNNFVGDLVKKLEDFGVRFFERNQVLSSKKYQVKATFIEWHDEIKCILGLLSVLFYGGENEAKDSGNKYNFPDVLHKIFKWHKLSPDRELLHALLETLLNYTDEYPKGSFSLTVTSNLISVPPKKSPTPQSLFIEILDILNNEMDQLEKNPNLKTIDLIFTLLRNCIILLECRNILAKSPLLQFMKRIHPNETKKWGPNQNHIKGEFLEFLVHLSFFPDMQLVIAKVPETLDILILLMDQDPLFSSKALKILRNLCFNQGNRVRFYCDSSFMPAISSKLRNSEDLEDLENAALGLSALISNSEKGKLLAKKNECPRSLLLALQRLQKAEKSHSSTLSVSGVGEGRDLSSLIDLLGKVYGLLSGPLSPSPISF